jgi:hypothetical protein
MSEVPPSLLQPYPRRLGMSESARTGGVVEVSSEGGCDHVEVG